MKSGDQVIVTNKNHLQRLRGPSVAGGKCNQRESGRGKDEQTVKHAGDEGPTLNRKTDK